LLLRCGAGVVAFLCLRCLELAMSVVSLSLDSFSSSFAGALRLLDSVAREGSLALSFASYGTGEAYVSFELSSPAAVRYWPALFAVAFADSGEGFSNFLADTPFSGPYLAADRLVDLIQEEAAADEIAAEMSDLASRYHTGTL
jgi:hypothetical protein